jgi:Ca-activated chloride channel homolog
MSLHRVILTLAGAALCAVIVAGQDSTKQDSSKPDSSTQSSTPATPAPASPDDLPSAPSATRAQQRRAVAPPAPSAPASSLPAAPAQTATPPSNPKASPAPGAGPDLGAPPDSSGDVETTIRRTVNEVDVLFAVTDRHGHYVTDLQRGDFQVLDNNQPPAEIRSFHRETNLPLEVGLLVDASNSVRDRFRFEQDSAIEFLNQTIRPRYDQAFVVGFDVTPEVTQDFTDNTELLSHGVRSLRPGGGTAMFDALYFACRDKLLKTHPGGLVRRAIIMLSDGDDNQSHVTREEAIDMADRADVLVYTISTNVTGSPDAGDKVLQRIADATGGRAFFPNVLTDIATNFQEIQEELRSQYFLSYTPSGFTPNGSFHTIDVSPTKTHKNLKVRSRRGYYAPTR